uniref:Uncharacterized protein n=1 Tax=Glossina palpalis gambiensis TaxID=67801 RepID=A0A1B0AQY5_9MUSC
MYNNNDKNIITISIERQKIIFLQANGTSYDVIVYLTDKQAFVIIALA